MAYAVISDIHSNKEALEAVLEDIKDKNISEIICLGDIVGYGADPAACCELVNKYCNSVIGNHDAYIAQIFIKKIKTEKTSLKKWLKQKIKPVNPKRKFGRLFRGIPNHLVYWAIQINYSLMKDKHKRFIARLPLEITKENAILSHQSPGTDLYDYKREKKGIEQAKYADYILSASDYFSEEAETIQKNGLIHDVLRYNHARPAAYALSSIQQSKKEIGIMGHSHVASYIAHPKNQKIRDDELTAVFITKNIETTDKNSKSYFEILLNPNNAYILNPGAVGQPRDNDLRASYLILDENKVIWNRIPYDAETACKKIIKAGIYPGFGNRLIKR